MSTWPYSLVVTGIANGDFKTMTDELFASLVNNDDKMSVSLTAEAGLKVRSVLAVLQPLDGAATVLQEVGGLLGLGTSVASLLTHANDLETIVRSVANFASLTSILTTASEAAALAANFKRMGERVTVRHLQILLATS